MGILFLPWEFFLDFPLKRNGQKCSNNDNEPKRQYARQCQISRHGFDNIDRDEDFQPKQNRARDFFANIRIYRRFRFFLNRILHGTKNSQKYATKNYENSKKFENKRSGFKKFVCPMCHKNSLICTIISENFYFRKFSKKSQIGIFILNEK